MEQRQLRYDRGFYRTSHLGCIHLVDSNDELPDTEGESKQRVLSGLAIFGDTGLELTSTGGNDEDSTISLGGTGDHVLDEVTVSRGINDLKDINEYPAPCPNQGWKKHTVTMYLGVSNFQRAISMVIPRSRSALSLSRTHAKLGRSRFESYRPDTEIALTVLEGTLPEFSGLLLELLNSTLVDTTTLIDQVTSGGRFSGVDVTNDYKKGQPDAGNDNTGALTDDINVDLLFTHSGFLEKMSAPIADNGEKEWISSTILGQIRREGRASEYPGTNRM